VISRQEEERTQRITASATNPFKSTTVAVVGYTNAGKTSLIKTLTCSKRIHGENRLFATLDATEHPALLPSGQRVVLTDTIGFISNLPMQLVASFSATLSHVRHAVSALNN